MRRLFGCVASLSLLTLGSISIPAQNHAAAARVREAYTKHDFRIRMRDGVALFTSVYAPNDDSREYPIMMMRTPYGVAPYGVDNYRATLGPSPAFEREGFIFVYQDVRGRLMSEGEFEEMTPHLGALRTGKGVDESSDAHDTVSWLLKNLKGHNGKVGIWGISYPGFFAAAALPDAHPAVKAVSPQAPIVDLFRGDDGFHNGAFMLAANHGFYVNFPKQRNPTLPVEEKDFDYGTPDGYEYYLRLGTLKKALDTVAGKDYFKAYLDHSTYDEFWRARDISAHMKNINPAVLIVGGLFDAEDLQGPQRLSRAIAKDSPSTPNTLVLGPWRHGGWVRSAGDSLGNLDFAQSTSVFYREEIEFPFFMKHLKGVEAALPRAWVFETGRNQWSAYDVWPPANGTGVSYFLSAKGALSPTAPLPGDASTDEYLADPNRPVPYLSYVNMGMRGDYMTEDQRFAATRPDVLVYATPMLESDVRAVGPVKVRLQVSSTATDADFVVRLIDVYQGDAQSLRPQSDPPPANAVVMGGYQQLVRGEPFRAKFRRSLEKPEPLIPGKVETIEFEMPDIAHTFRTGHKIMVQVHSSWFPLVDRNPQKFMNIAEAEDADFVKATHKVHRGSSVTLNVVP